MQVTTKITVDLTRPNVGTRVNAVQGDGNTRLVEITLLAGGVPWTPPDGMEAAIAYMQPGGTKGMYNLLADGTAAISISGNVATIILAPQMLTASGTVQASLVFNDASLNRLTTFPFSVPVTSNPAAGAQKVEDYLRLQWLEDKLDEYLRKAADSGAFDGAPGQDYVLTEADKIEIAEMAAGMVEVPDSGGNVDLTGYATEQFVREGYQPKGNYLTEVPDGYAKTEDIPTKPEDIGALPNTYTPPNQTAEQVGADPKGTAETAVSQHNTADDSHGDIRLELKRINDLLTAFFDSGDQTLDELSEIVAYITSNKSLIDSVTTSKVSVADIINNLTTNVANKPLSAAQGVVLKGLIDAVSTSLASYQPKGDYALTSAVPTKVSQLRNDKGYLTEHQDISGLLPRTELPAAVNDALAQAKESGEFDGEDGADGKTPVRGVDYWTDADKAEFSTYIATELAKRNQLAPEYAESIEDCTDTTKLYVLPDGFIYAYMLTEKEVTTGPSYTNVLPTAINSDGTPYVGTNGEKGYKTGYRLNSSATEVVSDANCCTGFIPAKNTDTIRFKNIVPASSGNGYIHFYDSNFNRCAGIMYEFWTSDIYEFVPATANELNSANGNVASDMAYFRISSGTISDDTIITVNEEITEGGGTEIVTEYAWANTGHAFVPADYENRIIAVEEQAFSNTKRIVTLEKTVKNGGDGDATEADALKRIKEWDKPVYDSAPVTLLADERTKPALTASDRTVSAVYAKYRALMAKHPKYITETNLGKSTASATFDAVDILRFDFKEPDGLVESSLYTINETKPKIILMSGVHNEYAGIYGLYYALEEIAENPDFDDIRRNAHIIVVPCSNPFGLTSQTAIDGWQMSHVNANGVAIHNNFGVEHNTYNANANVGEFNYGGTEPYSELETQYIDRVMAENTDAIAFVTCHNYNNDSVFGSLAIWASSATAHMCNLAYRLIDKISKAWHSKYGTALQNAIDTYKTDALPEGETRLGWAQYSTSAGTEQLNATKYGILATNLEISDNMRVFSDSQFSSDVMTHGAEVYANFMRTLLWSYDHKDKKEYAPNLPWGE